MNRETVKPILIGILLGAALFMMPFFLIRALVFFLIIGALFRLLRGRSFRRWNHRELHPAFTDTIRDMNEEEYRVYRQKLEANFYSYATKKGEDNK
jgi:hypothetical protein